MLIDDVCKVPELWREEIKKMKSMEVPIVLFGAGNTREFNLEYFHSLGIKPVAFCDNSPNKVGGKVGELEILAFSKVKEMYPDAYFYITTQLYYRELFGQILEAGYKEEQISKFDIIFQLQWEKDCMEYYTNHMQEVETLYKSLADESSRQVLRNRLLFFRTRERKYMLEVREKNQYFSEELIDFSEVKCFVDLGMYTGDTVLQFVEATKGEYLKIYGFEPDKEIYEIAKNNLKDIEKVTFVKKATSDYDGSVQVAQALGMMQTIEGGVFGEEAENANAFEVCKLDTFFKEKQTPNTMLKMDIEGAELATLMGGNEWIKRNRPVMAICVYHKQEDILTIPEYCKRLVPEYKLYLRHYSDNHTETVCYLVP